MLICETDILTNTDMKLTSFCTIILMDGEDVLDRQVFNGLFIYMC